MGNNFVFSWAEDAQGKMVHVDDVPRGLACGCVCPCCHEKLLARHGDVKDNDGMAHCGAYYSMGVPQKTPPDSAQTCNRFEPK